MSTYKNHIDFITRTQELLSEYEGHSDKEKTLFLNCCVGLLIMPQQTAQHEPIEVKGLVNYEDWGIDTKKIVANTLKRGNNKNSVANIAYHMRNSIAHYRFDVMNCNKEYIKNIHIVDKASDNLKAPDTFDLTLEFSDFRKFVMKYAELLKEELKKK